MEGEEKRDVGVGDGVSDGVGKGEGAHAVA